MDCSNFRGFRIFDFQTYPDRDLDFLTFYVDKNGVLSEIFVFPIFKRILIENSYYFLGFCVFDHLTFERRKLGNDSLSSFDQDTFRNQKYGNLGKCSIPSQFKEVNYGCSQMSNAKINS